MNLEILYFDECPNHEALLPRLRALLEAARIDAAVELRRITSGQRRARASSLGAVLPGRPARSRTHARSAGSLVRRGGSRWRGWLSEPRGGTRVHQVRARERNDRPTARYSRCRRPTGFDPSAEQAPR